METIKIQRWQEPVCEVYNNRGRLQGVIRNEAELAMLRLEIQKTKVSGTYIIYDDGDQDHVIDIDMNGEFVNDRPEGFYDKSYLLNVEWLKNDVGE